MKSNADVSENRFLGNISASSIRNLLPRSVSSKHKMNSIRPKSRLNGENIPPPDPNIQADTTVAPIPKLSPSIPSISQKQVARLESPKRITPPPTPPSDPPVKVIARIRPLNSHEKGVDLVVRKVSDDALSVGDRKFVFDSVLDCNSSQEDVFQSVGVPLVKSALAGYNTSVMAYGQTGGGKTFTMWGPPSAMIEGQSTGSNQGIVPRIFQLLFAEIQREQEHSDGKQINFQCRCSFLEIHNEQIGDLLDPTMRNLEIKEDAKHGFYVENLTEEYVTSNEEVTQLLIKGLSSRKVGATSINSKSSRSHIVFTCIIESWSKGTSSTCFSSSKTSRITLVDLAGQEKSKLDDDADKQYVKEGKYVKKSLSQLGCLVNTLSERTQSESSEEIHYRSSCLTHLLRETLGGNSKLTVICAISPDNKYSAETISTLRFGQRVKSILNHPVVNEISEDDVNDLSDQIRQLKEELIRAKSYSGTMGGNLNGGSVRQSLNQLRLSLNRSLILPHLDNDLEDEEEVHIDENDVRELRIQLDTLRNSFEENSQCTAESRGMRFFSAEGCETDLTCEHYASCAEESENEEINSDEQGTEIPREDNIESMDSMSISVRRESVALNDPPFSESPKIGSTQRKSLNFSTSHLGSCQDKVMESYRCSSNTTIEPEKASDQIRSSLRSSKVFVGPTESLAASLQRGLQIIDYHQKNSASNKSLASFSFEHLALQPSPTADKGLASVHTLDEVKRSLDGLSAPFLCSSCKKRELDGSDDAQDSLKTWIVAVNETNGQVADQVPKEDATKELADAMKREKELEIVCKEQAARIEQLNQLVRQYEEPKSDFLPTDELEKETKLLNWNDGETNEPEIKKEKCEIKEVQEEETMDHEFKSVSFDMNEKETLLREIKSLRSKLESNAEVSVNKSIGRLRSSLLVSQSFQLRKSGSFPQANTEDELEKERERWMEMESDWISLTDDLRIDLQTIRTRAEKVEMELRLEKKCTEELDDALKRSVLGHARMVEHYVDLQEKYNDLVGKHRLIMEGVAEVKRAAAKAGAKGHGSRFAKCLAAELSVLRVERGREREMLRKENKSLKNQLRETAEAVHAAGQLLVRLKEAEEAASVTEGNFRKVEQDNEKLKKQVEKLKRKHTMEMMTMKQYLAESRLPEAALRPLYSEDPDLTHGDANEKYGDDDDDQAWRTEFGAIYQEHY